MVLRSGRLILLPAILALTLIGCSDSYDESDDANGYSNFEGEVDPVSGSAFLKRVEVGAGDGTPVRIELTGRFVRPPVPAGAVALAVAIRNVDTRALYPPAELVLSHFLPPEVHPLFDNADWVICPTTTGDSTVVDSTASLTGCVFGYEYAELLGDDGALTPGETSGEKLMMFHDPDNVSFSFRVEARFSLQPDMPGIAGHFFADLNGNGYLDPGEPPFGGGWVDVTGPAMDRRRVQVDSAGDYSIRVREAGLYNLWATPPPTFAPVEPTTPNPLEVVLLRGPDGRIQSFLHADFGWVNSPMLQPVGFVDDGDTLEVDPYQALDGFLAGHALHLAVGFSGCGPDHPFALFMVGAFMESFPVQANLVLSHDDRGELCDAYWVRNLAFDMRPIQRVYESQYGRRDPIILHLRVPGGSVQTFELHP